jgi:hypothetical protein
VGLNRRGSFAAAAVAIVCALTPGSARAQQDTESNPSGIQKLFKRVQPPDQGGGFHFKKHLAMVFGGIKPGQGIALGPALSTTFSDGGYGQLKGVYSVRNFKLLQGRYDTRRFWSRRAILSTHVRWQDAPDLALYELGPESPRDRAQYGERKTEISSTLDARLSRFWHASGGAGIESYAISTGNIDVGEDHALAGVPLEPGLSTHPWFSHLFGGVAFDTRASGYARSGTIFDAAAGDYRDWHDGTYAFQHFEAGAKQSFAIGSRGSIGVLGRIWTSYAAEGHLVPFYLMPTLGGGEVMEAYNTYRFRDRDAAWVRGEYRHAVHEMIDAVGFYEAGTVAPTVRELTSAHAAHDIGGGVIVHNQDAALLRVDVARGSDGFGVAFVFSAAR